MSKPRVSCVLGRFVSVRQEKIGTNDPRYYVTVSGILKNGKHQDLVISQEVYSFLSAGMEKNEHLNIEISVFSGYE